METRKTMTGMTSANATFFRRMALSLLVLCTALCLTSCNDGEEFSPHIYNEKTLLLYYPWSGDNFALTNFFYQNISHIKEAIAQDGLNNERVIVFISMTSTKAQMLEITCNNGTCEERLLRDYDHPDLTTAKGITTILNDAKHFAPAQTYAMVVGGHGLGWITVDGYNSLRGMRRMPHLKGNTDGIPLTRFFGGSQSNHRTDITTFADGIKGAGMKMEYILFDVCAMSTVEVVYDLRHVTDYVIATPTEILNIGMPYRNITRYLLGKTNYSAINREYIDFYNNYTYPYATLGITDCRHLEPLATVMREINGRFSFDDSQLTLLQRLDGESECLFYDLGDYVDHLCGDSTLLAEFHTVLDRAVPYHSHTEYYPYAYKSSLFKGEIHSYSGLSTSAPSKNSLAADVVNTSWYIDTH